MHTTSAKEPIRGTADRVSRLVIVGSVAAGTSVGAKARRNDEELEIVVYDRDRDISYSGCGLPYYVGGQVADADELHPRTPAWFAKRYNMDIRTGHEVIAVDHEARTMRVVELATGEEFTDSYDTLVLATGARTIVPPIPGVDAPGVFAVRNVQKALQIVDVRSAKDYAKARVPGAVNIPLGEIRDRAGELDPQATTVTYCNKGVSRPPGRPAVWQHGDRRPRSRTE